MESLISQQAFSNGEGTAVRSSARPLGAKTRRDDRSAPRRLVILGATGSIGRSCAQVIARLPGRFEVAAIAGGRDGAALAKAAIELNASFAAVADLSGYAELKAGTSGHPIEVAAGPDAVVEAA